MRSVAPACVVGKGEIVLDAVQPLHSITRIMLAGRPQNAKNIQPRFGFALQLNPATVLRGGVGKYYGEMLSLHVPRRIEDGGARRGHQRRPTRFRRQPVQRFGRSRRRNRARST